jgi:hypothetical protein
VHRVWPQQRLSNTHTCQPSSFEKYPWSQCQRRVTSYRQAQHTTQRDVDQVEMVVVVRTI